MLLLRPPRLRQRASPIRGTWRPAAEQIAAPEELLAAQGGITLRSRSLAPARVVWNAAAEENADGAAEVSDGADPEEDEPKAKRPRAVRRIAADPYAPECAPAACDDGSASAGLVRSTWASVPSTMLQLQLLPDRAAARVYVA